MKFYVSVKIHALAEYLMTGENSHILLLSDVCRITLK